MKHLTVCSAFLVILWTAAYLVVTQFDDRPTAEILVNAGLEAAAIRLVKDYEREQRR